VNIMSNPPADTEAKTDLGLSLDESDDRSTTKTQRIRISAISSPSHPIHLDEREHKETDVLASVTSHEQLFQELFESVYDAVIITEMDGRIIKANGRAIDFFQYDRFDIFYLNILDLICNADTEILRVTRNNLQNKRYVFIEAFCIRKDSTFFPADITVNTIHLSDDGQLCFFIRNVTERRQTEDKLKETQKELVKTAHSAGMATIATGVLHDVGNILNSVNVSGEMIVHSLENSALQNLLRVNDLLWTHRDDFVEFINNHPEPDKLSLIYRRIAEELCKEREQLSQEANDLLKKIDLIKEVVKTQQEYAKLGHFKEGVNFENIVEDAVAIQKASIEKNSLQIQKRYPAKPQISVPKAKFLHVIVNLLTNAMDAMAENSKDNRILEIETGITDHEVYIRMADNGKGISRENMTRIFNHGFSTKTNGHGFGLHTSANFMTEMGGRITVQSDGPGHGAAFTLYFPVITMESEEVDETEAMEMEDG